MSDIRKISTPLISSSLVVGGCGFLGFHLTRQLLQDDESGQVYVLDRDVSRNRHEDVSYIKGDISDGEFVRGVINDVGPSVIFHCASPIAALPMNREGEFYATNVKGTEVILTAAFESDAVRAFVFTSSVDAYANPPPTKADETYPLWSPNDKSNEYNRTKAIGDSLVREANGTRLRTVTLRPGHAYGERHVQGMVEVLDMCKNKKLVQIGDGKNLMEVVSGENNAIAHVLAAKALLDPGRASGKVDGEAFNVSDGAPVPFWHHTRLIWETARSEDVSKDIIVLPAWVMIVAVFAAEWLFWIFTLNTAKPPVELRTVSLEYCVYTHTYSIEKARKRLGFNPVSNHDAVVAQSARWMLKYRESMKQKSS
ncbi:C-3 sterol dehydrogenase C-4 decarboxylase [Fusarium agapanthi]|uniref:C-3 sterol dehydrogenase C-4 decarboxylase n=1 Tax=Fusarium agapanthi TaxID=1803897 RepID=A0A9P5E6A3_9HYPO|nr:C-3 sterol dehydrogenase C-4 decarboxylase [Fusarium agapanthi]